MKIALGEVATFPGRIHGRQCKCCMLPSLQEAGILFFGSSSMQVMIKGLMWGLE